MLRARFRPAQISILLVGESPPAGGTFFYDGDSNLFWHTWKAFTMAIPAVPEIGNFLRWFQEHGWYLADLCAEPINSLSDAERRRFRVAGEEALAQLIAVARPSVVVGVMLALRDNVRRAVAMAGYPCAVHCLPFPAMGHQHKFERRLAAIIRKVIDQ